VSEHEAAIRPARLRRNGGYDSLDNKLVDGPADDATEITSAQFGAMIDRLISAGQWKPGELDVVIVADAG